MLGYTNNALTAEQRATAITAVLGHAAAGRIRMAYDVSSLAEVEAVWTRQAPVRRRRAASSCRADLDLCAPRGRRPPLGVNVRLEDMTDTDDRQKLVELMRDMPIAMLTTLGSTGPRSVPMARQEVEPDAELWFITARDTDHVRAIAAGPARRPDVLLA